MDRRKKMANRKAILEYWQGKFSWHLREDFCWGCNIPCVTQRCHIHAMQNGGHDEPSNLILLCHRCHYLQEIVCSTATGRRNFVYEMVMDLIFYEPRALEYDTIRALMSFNPEEQDQ